jgi:hypothetical protein
MYEKREIFFCRKLEKILSGGNSLEDLFVKPSPIISVCIHPTGICKLYESKGEKDET